MQSIRFGVISLLFDTPSLFGQLLKYSPEHWRSRFRHLVRGDVVRPAASRPGRRRTIRTCEFLPESGGAALATVRLLLTTLFLAGAILQAQDERLDSLIRAGALTRAGNYIAAQRAYQETLAHFQAGQDIQVRSYVMSQLADLDILFGHSAAAETKTRDALRLLAEAGRERTREAAIVLGVLANALNEQGKYREADEKARQAVSLGEETLPGNSAEFAILLNAEAQILDEIGKPRAALNLARKCTEIFERLRDQSVINLGVSYENLAIYYADDGNSKKAFEYLDKATVLWEKTLPAEDPHAVYLLAAKATIYLKFKLLVKAEEIVPSMLERGESSFLRQDPVGITLLSSAAAIYVARKRYADAEPLLRDGIRLAGHLLPAGHPTTRRLLLGYSTVLEKLNRKQEASLMRSRAAVVLASSIGAPPK